MSTHSPLYDLLIIGGGPAGAAAGVYAARKRLRTALVAESFGGQSVVSPDIQNWVGTVSISGAELAEALKEHVQAYADDVLDIVEGTRVKTVAPAEERGYLVTTDDDQTYHTRALLVCSGSSRRQLDVPGAEKFEHKGVTYCASCDGPMFTGQDVVVIGGGNAGMETAAQLLAYANSVTLLHRNAQYKAEKITTEEVLKHENMTGITNAQITEVYGDAMVEGVKYRDTETDEIHDLSVSGVFVEIGQIPNTDFVADLVELDDYNRITIDPWTQQASAHNIWAAGDCSNIRYHQNNIAAGDAVRAVEDLYIELRTKDK